MSNTLHYLALASTANDSLMRALRLMARCLQTTAVGLYLENRDGKLQRAAATAGYPPPDAAEHALVTALASDQLAVVSDAASHPELCEHPWVDESPGWSSLASAPLETSRRAHPIGYVVAAAPRAEHFSPCECEVLEDFAELVVERLEMQMSQAEVAGEMDRMITIGILAAGVAHEINNPLSFVGGNIQFALRLLEEDLEEFELPNRVSNSLRKVSDALQDALVGSRRVRDVVRDLRRLAGGTDTDDYTIEPVHVLDPLQSSLSIARKHIEQRARLVRDFEEVPEVMGNESKLGQVFLNLLINAAQAIPRGDVAANEVRVRAFERDKDVVVSIRDSGTGIADEVFDKIFDPFFTTKPRNEGTGLGLAISYNIVRNLSGEIEVDTTPGEGTTFRVVLPSTEKLTSQLPPS